MASMPAHSTTTDALDRAEAEVSAQYVALGGVSIAEERRQNFLYMYGEEWFNKNIGGPLPQI